MNLSRFGSNERVSCKWKQFGKRAGASDLRSGFKQSVTVKDNLSCVIARDGKESYEVIVSGLEKIGEQIKESHLTYFDVFTNYDYDRLIIPRGYKRYSSIQNYKASNVAKYIGRTNIMPPDIMFGTYLQVIIDGTFVESDHYMFVLQDKANGSGMESYLSSFKTIENTIFIGTSSNGLQICGGNYSFFLPYSGFEVQFGMNMKHQEDITENIDCIGYEPDIWIEPSEAQDAIRRMCIYYQL